MTEPRWGEPGVCEVLSVADEEDDYLFLNVGVRYADGSDFRTTTWPTWAVFERMLAGFGVADPKDVVGRAVRLCPDWILAPAGE